MKLTTDALVVVGRKVVLIRRAKAPFMDKLVLPGGHVEESETTREACIRELQEEIGLEVEDETRLTFRIVLDHPDRDPRPGRRVSVVYTLHLSKMPELKAGSDAREIVVRKIDSLDPDEIGFDHWQAIKAYKQWLAR